MNINSRLSKYLLLHSSSKLEVLYGWRDAKDRNKNISCKVAGTAEKQEEIWKRMKRKTWE
jgi:hypothetical protein